MVGCRTDLCAEELPQNGGELEGVKSREYERDGFAVTDVEVLNEAGSLSL